jgi:putative transposase
VAYPAGVSVLISLAAQRGHKEYAMVQGKQSAVLDPEGASEVFRFGIPQDARSVLDQLVRDGARQMLHAALEDDVNDFLEANASKTDQDGRRLVVRNGYMASSEIITRAGCMEIQQPRVRDKSPNVDSRVRFSSKVLLPYLRRSKAIDELIPWLYLKGVSTGDFSDALESLTVGAVVGLSPNTVVRLKESWSKDFENWNARDLSSKKYLYFWADGIHVYVRLEDQEHQRQCILVLMGGTEEGQEELIAVVDGYRESEASWTELLADVKTRE